MSETATVQETLQNEKGASIVAPELDARLGIITGSLAARDERGRVILSFALGRLLEAIRERAPQTRVCLPVLPQVQQGMNHVLQYPDGAIIALPPLRTTIESQKHYRRTKRILREFAAASDLLFVRLPFQLPRCLLNLGKPKLLQVVSNPLEVVKASSDYGGVMKLLAQGFASDMEKTMRRLIAEDETRIVTNGRQMWNKLGCRAGRVVVSSCIHESEMRPRTDFKLNEPPRLLFVGYVRPEKGVPVLLEAFTRLRAQGRTLKLTLVGGSDRASGAETEMRELIERNPFRADIEIKGTIDYGDELFELYRTHDVYVLPSLSEGTPRTLVEARGFGCPVVATNVGGIPTSIEHGVDGLLVEPNRPDLLAEATARVLDDEKLRLSLIEAGLERARSLTLENFAGQLMSELSVLGSVDVRSCSPIA